MRAEGWRRLWELTKWLVSLGVAGWVFLTVMPSEVPAPDAIPTVGQVMMGVLFVTGLAGGATFALLHAFEWVWRGFRPLPVSPMAGDQPDSQAEPPDTTPTTVGKLEHHPALPHPDSQQMNEREQQR